MFKWVLSHIYLFQLNIFLGSQRLNIIPPWLNDLKKENMRVTLTLCQIDVAIIKIYVYNVRSNATSIFRTRHSANTSNLFTGLQV